VLSRECADLPGEFLVALEVIAADRAGVAEARIRAASAVDPDWIVPTSSATEHRFDRASGRVRAARVDRYDALVLREYPVAPESSVAARLVADAWLERGPDPPVVQLLRRARFAGCDIDVPALVAAAAMGASAIDAIDVAGQLPYETARTLASQAPEVISLPSGRTAKVDYAEDGTVSAAVKLQELFGLAETPRLGPRRVPVTFYLLAPNGRPVQTTSDLRSFWERTYPEVRRELRGRYPKHPWPEDPWTATPTHRTKPR
jgi:ATP-dependent helicase HrpB